MQDKEFDGLFRDRLDGFESEPSERVWIGIDAGLEGKKRPALFWLSIAASIVVLVTAGILFIPKGDRVTQNSQGLAIHKPQRVTTKPAEQVAVNIVPAVKQDVPVKQDQPINTNKEKPMIVAPAPVKPYVTIAKDETIKTVDQPVLAAAVVTPKMDQVKPTAVVPDKEIPLVIKPEISPDVVTNTAKPALIAKTQPEVKPGTPAVKKHGIRSFGDLVNMVVAKVDKRKDKAVQFTEDEDGDGSTLTAVNIGPLKIGKDDKNDK